MSSLDMVMPFRVTRIEKSDLPDTEIGEESSHAAGYTAGYEQGRLRAEWEGKRQQLKESEKVKKLVQTLENLHCEYEALLAEHLPDLIQGALKRVYRQHPFTAEEIGHEVAALLIDMEQAGRIALECSPAQADELGRQLEACDAIADTTKWNLQPNPALHLGEFILKSDLGDVDGRHSSRIRQIHLALEGNS